MSQDVIVNGTTYPGVEAISMTDANGNTVFYYPDAVRYVEQALTKAQQEQARKNIGIDEAFKAELVAAVIENLGGYPVVGYVDENNNIIVSGDLPDGSYTVKYEMEDGSTVGIGDLVLDTKVYYSVTNTLTNCTSNNSAKQVAQGEGYSATITANSGYELKTVTVTMGGSPVTVSGGKISISNVTGNIVITAGAEVAGPAYTNLADPDSADWKEGYRLSISSGNPSALAGHTATNFIPCKLGDVLRVKGLTITSPAGTEGSASAKIVAYNSSKTKITGGYGLPTSGSDQHYALKVTKEGDVSVYTPLIMNNGTNYSTSGMTYIRLDGFLMDGYTKNDVIITVNEEIV